MRTLLLLTTFLVFIIHYVASTENGTLNVDCGNTSFSGSDGVVTSPNFPLPYPHDLSCTYSIDVGLNNSVVLKFIDFDLEEPLFADNCTQDWLTITCNETDDENPDFEKRFCGSDLPRTSLWFSNCPVVLLNFFADSSIDGGGFSIEYTIFDNSSSADFIKDLDCGDTEFTDPWGAIRLPANPTEYPARVNCSYTIMANHSSIFALGLISLQIPQLLDSFEDCDKDNIEIGCVSEGETGSNWNTSNTLYCRTSFDNFTQPPGYVIFTNCLTLKISIRSSDYNFRGDNSLPFLVSTSDEDCGTTSYTDPTGVILSPRFPLSHPHNLECFYYIDVDRTKTVSLDFHPFSLDGHSDSWRDYCPSTWITVSCLVDDGSILVNPHRSREYCGEKPKPLLLNYSNCDYLMVNFVANSSVNKGDFQLRYEVSPGNSTRPAPEKLTGNVSYTGPTGFITSPRFPLHYPYNSDYVYSIDIDRNKTVGLFFYTFNIEGYSNPYGYMDSCPHDWLLITCPSAAYQHYYHHYYNRNTKYCGVKTTPIIRSYTACDSLTLNFVSDSSVNSEGFKIWYTITSPGQSVCSNTSFSGSDGVITSPNFPLSYPLDSRCTYSIDVGRNSTVLLKFKYFQLEEPNAAGQCANDWLMITCNETAKANANYMRKLCGSIQWNSSMQFDDCSSLELEFVSRQPTSLPGFMIEYTVTENSNFTDEDSELDCGSTLFTDSSGVINLPMNPTNILTSVNCTYTISTNQTSLIWLNVSITSATPLLRSFQDCSTENLTIGCVSEGSTEPNPNTTRVFCRNGGPAFRLPNQHSLFVFADCQALKLTVRSNAFDHRETFRIPFSVYEPGEECGNTSFSNMTGAVSYPRFSFSYPKNVSCLYTIESGQPDSYTLRIDRLYNGYYYSDRSCNSFWLTITCMVNGTSMSHPLANRRLCEYIYSATAVFPECDVVFIRFFGASYVFDKGFSIRYRIGDDNGLGLDCGTTEFMNSSGVIALPRNPSNSLATVNCTYTISANNSLSYIWLNTDFYTQSELFRSFQDCARENMTVGCLPDGRTEVDPATKKVFCRNLGPSWYSSTFFANCRTLKFFVSSRAYDYQQLYNIRFSVVGPDNVCGALSLPTPTGVVTAPQLQFRYSSSVNCRYTIDIGNITSVSLRLESLRISNDYYGSTSCPRAGLTITCMVNGTPTANQFSNRRLCGYMSSMAERFPACSQVIFNYYGDYLYSDRYFQIRYRVGDYEVNCGSTQFNSSSGVIRFPQNPTGYPAMINCNYTISANSLSHMWINPYYSSWSRFLESSRGCERESLTFGCVSEGRTELIPNTTRVICKRIGGYTEYISQTYLVFIDCTKLQLTIRSDMYTYMPFSIAYTVFGRDVLCGNTSYSSQNGIVSSPRLPQHFPKLVNCLYVIESDHVNSVVLNINRFSLGAIYDGSCNLNWLKISCLINGTSMAHPLADRKLCGALSSTVARFPACESLLLNFSSDYSDYEAGFSLRYRTGDYDPDCGNTSYKGVSGFITSPKFPLAYAHNLNCLYSIIGGQTKVILLSVLSMDISGYASTYSADSCCCDWVTASCLSDESETPDFSSSRRYCGVRTTPLQFTIVSCPVVLISFRSDSWSSGKGFNISYTVMDKDGICGNTSFSNTTGVISSPRLFQRTPNVVNCLYSIESDTINSVALIIDRLSLGPSYVTSGSCDINNWLTITCLVNGTSTANPVPDRKLCGTLITSTVVRFPACQSVLLNFSNDYSIQESGFTLRYRIGDYELDCGSTQFTNSSGVIRLPQNPTNSLATVNCTYTISADRLSHMWINPYLTSWYNFLLTSRDCDRESLTIGCIPEGETELNPNTTRVLCKRIGGSTISISETHLVFIDCPKLQLSIQSDTYDQRTIAFAYTVFGPNELCGNTSFSAGNGVVTSPRLPLRYPTAVNCLYVIESDHETSVTLNIDRFNLYASNGLCNVNWLMITCFVNGTSMAHPLANRKLCGTLSSTVAIFPECQSVLLNFSSDYSSYESGFSIRYRMGDYDPVCGNTSYRGSSGFVTSPRFPLEYAHGLNCLYSIAGGQNKVITLTILSMHLEGSVGYPVDSCCCDWVTVSCLSDETSLSQISSSRRYCGYRNTPLKFTFSSCPVAVLTFRTDGSVSYGGFNVSYTIVDTASGCGLPAYDSPSGVISFPSNSTDLVDSIVCNYVINAMEPSSISLTVWSLSVERSEGMNCQRDWLLMNCIDGKKGLTLNISHQSCDDYLNASMPLTFAECKTVKVVFHGVTGITGKTFLIEYTVTSKVEGVSTTVLPITSVLTTKPVETDGTCATGCIRSSDLINCVCLTDSSQTSAVLLSTEIPPATGSVRKCEDGCKISPDGTSCHCPAENAATGRTGAVSISTETPTVTPSATKCGDGCEVSTEGASCECSTTPSGAAIDNTHIKQSSERGRSVGISLTVILLIIGAICLGAFWFIRRRQKKARSEMLLEGAEEERAQKELDDGTKKSAGSLFGAHRSKDRGTSRYLPLKAMSGGDREENDNFAQNDNEIEPGL